MICLMTRRFPVLVGAPNRKWVPNVGFPAQFWVPEPVDMEDPEVSLKQHMVRCFANDYSRRASNTVPEMRRVRPRSTCTS